MQKLLPYQAQHQKLAHAGENPQRIVPLKSLKIYGANSCASHNKSSAIIHTVARVLKAQTCTHAHTHKHVAHLGRSQRGLLMISSHWQSNSHIYWLWSQTQPNVEIYHWKGWQRCQANKKNTISCYVCERLKPLGNLSCSRPQRRLTAAINTSVHMITVGLFYLFIYFWFSSIPVTLGIGAQQNTSCLLTSAAHYLETK